MLFSHMLMFCEAQKFKLLTVCDKADTKEFELKAITILKLNSMLQCMVS